MGAGVKTDFSGERFFFIGFHELHKFNGQKTGITVQNGLGLHERVPFRAVYFLARRKKRPHAVEHIDVKIQALLNAQLDRFSLIVEAGLRALVQVPVGKLPDKNSGHEAKGKNKKWKRADSKQTGRDH